MLPVSAPTVRASPLGDGDGRGRLPARRRGGLPLAALVLALLPIQALADHGVPAPPFRGIGWTTWLLVAGAVVAVGLAAWAFLAPERAEPPAQDAPPPLERRP